MKIILKHSRRCHKILIDLSVLQRDQAGRDSGAGLVLHKKPACSGDCSVNTPHDNLDSGVWAGSTLLGASQIFIQVNAVFW